MEKVYIYALTDPRDGSVHYIGQTTTLRRRKRFHERGYGSGERLGWIQELHKQGLVPRFKLLEGLPDYKTANERESWWILHGHLNGWPLANLTAGRGGRGYEHTEEAKRKISEARQGKPGHPQSEEARRLIGEASSERVRTEETRRRQSESLKAYYASEAGQETRQRISTKLIGHSVSGETRRKIGQACRGYRHTEEAKRKIGEASRRRARSEETRCKIGDALRGKPKTEEHRRKISEAKKCYWVRKRAEAKQSQQALDTIT